MGERVGEWIQKRVYEQVNASRCRENHHWRWLAKCTQCNAKHCSRCLSALSLIQPLQMYFPLTIRHIQSGMPSCKSSYRFGSRTHCSPCLVHFAAQKFLSKAYGQCGQCFAHSPETAATPPDSSASAVSVSHQNSWNINAGGVNYAVVQV